MIEWIVAGAIGLVALIFIALISLPRGRALYCPLCGNAVTNEWRELVVESGSTYMWTWRACPIYRDQRTDHDIPWTRHYHVIVKSELLPSAFDPITGEERRP